MPVVVLETWVAYNFLMDALVLWSAGRLGGHVVGKKRLALACALGVIGAMGAQFLTPWASAMLAILLPGVLAWICYRPPTWRHLAIWTGRVMLSACLWGGAGTMLFQAWGRYAALIGWVLLPLGGIAATLVLCSANRQRRDTKRQSIRLILDTYVLEVPAFLDTGNALYEPIGGLGVIVVPLALLPKVCLGAYHPSALAKRADVRYAGFESLGGTGVLPCIPIWVRPGKAGKDDQSKRNAHIGWAVQAMMAVCETAGDAAIVPAQIWDSLDKGESVCTTSEKAGRQCSGGWQENWQSESTTSEEAIHYPSR